MTKQGWKQLKIEVPEGLHRKLKVYAAEKDMTLKELILTFIRLSGQELFSDLSREDMGLPPIDKPKK